MSLSAAFLLMITALAMMGCDTKMGVDSRNAQAPEPMMMSVGMEIMTRSPLVVSPGATVELTGNHFLPVMTLSMADGRAIDLRVASDTQASFVVPDDVAFGVAQLTATQGDVTQQISLVFDAGKTDYPLFNGSPDKVCQGEKFYDANGTLAEGTRLCGTSSQAAPACTSDGQLACTTNATFPSVDKTNLIAGHIKSGVTIGGVAGALIPSPAACSSDGQTACVTGVDFKAAAMAGFTDSDIRDGVTIAGVTGGLAGAPPSCSVDGETACLTNTNYRAAATTGLASKVLDDATVAGIAGNVTLPSVANVLLGTQFGVSGNALTGTLTLPAAANVRVANGDFGVGGDATTPTLADCAADGGSSCVVDGVNYKAAASAALLAANIKRGVQLGGVTGNFPSASSPLPRYSDSGATTTTAGADETDLTSFETQLKSNGTFEFWDSSGVRRTGAGDADIADANVVSGVEFENLGVTGTAVSGTACTGDGQEGCVTTTVYKSVDTSALSEWDIRKGKSAGGIAGSFTLYKNMGSTATFNRTVGTGALAGLDIYDTVDDYNNNGSFLTDSPSGWDQLTGANWTRDALSDNGAGGGTASNGVCDGTEDCVYKDEITGLLWARADGYQGTWEEAITHCEALNGSSYGGYASGWRLPTQKEHLQGYNDGIWSIFGATQLNLAGSPYWTSSTLSTDTAFGWTSNPRAGSARNYQKTSNYDVACVR